MKHFSTIETDPSGNKAEGKQSSTVPAANPSVSEREAQYRSLFVTTKQPAAPSGFIPQVDGYGVQVFAQASSFVVS
jgi:hypothetical protein